MSDLDNRKESIYYKDKFCHVLYDAYPKSTYHLLVVPNDINIRTFKNLTQDHITLLKHMDDLSQEIMNFLSEKTKLEFKSGFHAIPSLKLIHLHIISQDFKSPCLKTKKHWNSFNTPFFLPCKEVMRQLEENKFVEFDQKKYEDFEDQDLQCPKTGKKFQTIPALKKYLESSK